MAKFFDQHTKVILPVAGAVLLLLYLAISGNFSLGWNSSDVMNGGNKKTYDQYPQNIIKSENDYEARIYVNGKGTIVVDLFEEDTPLAVNNFVFLSNEDFIIICQCFISRIILCYNQEIQLAMALVILVIDFKMR